MRLINNKLNKIGKVFFYKYKKTLDAEGLDALEKDKEALKKFREKIQARSETRKETFETISSKISEILNLLDLSEPEEEDEPKEEDEPEDELIIRLSRLKPATESPQKAQAVPALEALHNALNKNDVAGVKLLISKDPAIVNFKFEIEVVEDDTLNRDSHTLLSWAIQQNNLDMVKFLVANGADVNQASENGTTPLISAIINNNLEIVQYLVNECHVDVNKASKEKTPLMCACELQHLDIIIYLAKNGVNVNALVADGETCLTHILIIDRIYNKNYLNVIDVLITKCGADVNEGTKKTPLIQAIVNRDLEMVKHLVKDYQADVNQSVGDEEFLPLIYAMRNSNFDIAEWLVKYSNVNVNQSTSEGLTPLILAIVTRNQLMLDLLKQNPNADVMTAMEIIKRKFFAHVMGLAGTSIIVDQTGHSIKLDLMGLTKHYAMQKLSEYASDFFHESDKNQGKWIAKKDREAIEECLYDAFQTNLQEGRNIAQIKSRIRSKKPVVIMGGCKGHAISLVIHNNTLVVCNRAIGENNFYDLSSFLNEKGDLILDDYFLFDLIRTHENEKSFDKMCSTLGKPTKTINQKMQKVGNCTWASSKAALSILFYFYMHDDENASKKVYKDFTTFARLKAYHDYEDDLRKPNSNSDRTLYTRAQTKLGAKKML